MAMQYGIYEQSGGNMPDDKKKDKDKKKKKNPYDPEVIKRRMQRSSY